MKSHDHQFKWWFAISPIRAILLARLKGGHCKPFTYQQWEDVAGENQHWRLIEIKEEVKKILGDINDDKKINSVDCILMIQIILGENANVHNLDFQKRADLNNDGQVNILDAILIRTYILKSF